MKFSLSVLLLLGLGSLAVAGPLTVAGLGNITNGAYVFAAGGGAAPTFNASHGLVNVGNNLGSVGAAVTPLSVANGAFPGAIGQCINLGGGCGVIGAPFGTANTFEYSGFYSINFFFALSDPGPNGQASITYSEANNVVFTNTSGGPVRGWVGAALAIQGNFGGQAGAVVGAALDGDISWNGGAAERASVVLFGSSLVGQPTSVNFTGVGGTGGSYFDCGFGFGCNQFIAYGVSLLNGGQKITINDGQTLNLTGALSVIVDPPSSSGIFVLNPLDVVPQGTILPDFGAVSTATPEPGTLGLAGAALSAIAWWGRRSRSRARK